MIIGAASIKILAGSAAVAGLVWAQRALRGRLQQAKAGRGPRVDSERAAPASGPDGKAEALDEIALAEALRDIRDMRQRRLEEMAVDPRDEPEDIDGVPRTADVGYFDHAAAPDEQYDALDAEDMGTEWLQRATQTSAANRQDPSALLEGTHGLEPLVFVDERGSDEAGFGSDQQGAPLARHAGTHDEDVAAELPVGNVDAQGNTVLHAPIHPPDAFGAPPTGVLAVSERELAGRNEPPKTSRR